MPGEAAAREHTRSLPLSLLISLALLIMSTSSLACLLACACVRVSASAGPAPKKGNRLPSTHDEERGKKVAAAHNESGEAGKGSVRLGGFGMPAQPSLPAALLGLHNASQARQRSKRPGAGRFFINSAEIHIPACHRGSCLTISCLHHESHVSLKG